jgi:hypothetical protein
MNTDETQIFKVEAERRLKIFICENLCSSVAKNKPPATPIIFGTAGGLD